MSSYCSRWIRTGSVETVRDSGVSDPADLTQMTFVLARQPTTHTIPGQTSRTVKLWDRSQLRQRSESRLVSGIISYNEDNDANSILDYDIAYLVIWIKYSYLICLLESSASHNFQAVYRHSAVLYFLHGAWTHTRDHHCMPVASAPGSHRDRRQTAHNSERCTDTPGSKGRHQFGNRERQTAVDEPSLECAEPEWESLPSRYFRLKTIAVS